uniref:NADH-ubiquinone oxidoreductase chain 6 n=1 Tax=Scirtidae sp. BMNH 1274304 TaxID=1796542 RepID=A0A126TE09_9COLE|nr:NADH dehydrogenase subunit 6 [Scirtidae sp. BMNH 1274304]
MSLMLIMNSMLFMLLKHPMSMGLMLLIQTINISLMIGMMMNNFWFSYILFLIMIGGLMILFMYMTSVAANEKFKFNPMLIMPMVITMIMFMFQVKNFNSLKLNMHKMDLIINKFLNFPMNLLMIMLIIYLLITMIVIVKITFINYGPLRQKF